MTNQYYYIVYEERMTERDKHFPDWTQHSAFIDKDPFSWMERAIEYRDSQGLETNIRIINAIEITYFTFSKHRKNGGMIS